jgi:tetratricopeptide (TPR) repeat protein
MQKILNRHGLGVAVLLLALAAVPVLHAEEPQTQAGTEAKVAELFESSFSHEATGNNQRALADMQEAVKLAPQHYLANLRVGWLAYGRQRYDESIAAYQRATELAPRALEPQLGVMLPLMAAKRWAIADKVGRSILAVAPRNYLATSRLAYIAFSQAKFHESEVLYRQVLDDYPGDIEMMLGLGWAQLRQGKAAEARQMFRQVLGISRQNASAKAGLEALK